MARYCVKCSNRAVSSSIRCIDHLRYDADWHFVNYPRANHHCSSCGEPGHNARRCGNTITAQIRRFMKLSLSRYFKQFYRKRFT